MAYTAPSHVLCISDFYNPERATNNSGLRSSKTGISSPKLNTVTRQRPGISSQEITQPWDYGAETTCNYLPDVHLVTRSHKVNDRDHSSEQLTSEHLPRYFAKSGPIDADPRKTKKDGGGKGNWGRSGDEVQDYGYTFTHARRHSNSGAQGIADFRTKFETIEAEPVFEEGMHGASKDVSSDGDMVTKVDSTSSASSVDK